MITREGKRERREEMESDVPMRRRERDERNGAAPPLLSFTLFFLVREREEARQMQ